jgi:hypothetical protein
VQCLRSDQADNVLPYDLAMSTVFALDYLLRWISVESRLTYIFTPTAIVDFFTTVPVFIEVCCAAAECSSSCCCCCDVGCRRW